MMETRTYPRRSFKKLPAGIAGKLDRLKEYQPGNPFPRDMRHTQIAREILADDPQAFTVIIFEELLDRKHINNKRFVNIYHDTIISELQETVHRHFGDEINRKMSEYLEEHRDDDDAYLNGLIRSYYPKARRLLLEHYKDIYPRSWRKKFDRKQVNKPRIEIRRERIFNIPEPLDDWDGRNMYQQYFIMPAKKAVCRGGGASSGQRENQSLFGYSFALIARHKPVESIILVYDSDNELKYVDTIHRFCVVPYDVGSNYDLKRVEARSVLDRTLKATKDGDIASISRIVVSEYNQG
jgi:hypothetical protein